MRARLAWGGVLLYLVLSTSALALMAQTPTELIPEADEPGPFAGELLFAMTGLLGFALVGALIAARQPRNPVGWLLLGGITLNSFSFFATAYVRYTLYADPGSLPAPAAMGWVGNLANDVQWGLFLMMLLLFPDGRLPARGWRLAVWFVVVVVAAEVLDSALQPGALEDFSRLENPLGVSGADFLADIDPDVVGNAGLLIAAAGLYSRWRRGGPELRRQVKGFVFALALLAVSIMAHGAIAAVTTDGTVELLSSLAIVLLFTNLALALGVSVLKHRLYDVDLVINRTLVYGALTATLAGAYLACVLLLQLVLAPLTQESGLAVAASTLAVAALFRPARARIQALVDRRFYRRRYDAARTLESFGSRLRDQVDLDSLSSDLRGVVRETVQPAHVSLWLRERTR